MVSEGDPFTGPRRAPPRGAVTDDHSAAVLEEATVTLTLLRSPMCLGDHLAELHAAERGIWKSTEMRRLLVEAGLEISAGKMSGWWTGTPNTIRLDELDVICDVLDCEPSAMLIPEPDKVAERRPKPTRTAKAAGS